MAADDGPLFQRRSSSTNFKMTTVRAVLQAYNGLEVAKRKLGSRLAKECRVLPKEYGHLMVA